jgi:hypothetical protein
LILGEQADSCKTADRRLSKTQSDPELHDGCSASHCRWRRLAINMMGPKYSKALVVLGFLKVVEDDVGRTYRAVYTVKFAGAVFVLHCFQKKSKRGIATPKQDMDIIHARLKIAEAYAKDLRK